MENFVLNKDGQIDINRKGMDTTYRFRLQEINHNTETCSSKDVCDDTATSISSYSHCKHRIDAMFDDSRSNFSDISRSERKRKLSHIEACKERVIANNIQEKIEKMFQEISTNGLQNRNSGVTEQPASSSPEGNLRHDFKVTYLGSKPLKDKNISLMSLQDPLKQLYFEHKKKPAEKLNNILTIFKEGLKIKVTDKEELNPFSTIAVWASVKLSFRENGNTKEYAFLPLVTDPDGVDKNLLFKELKPEDKFVQEKGKDENQYPIFAVVMKNVNMNKQLECHGFICESPEEAIVLAANLYQALMKKLKRKKNDKVKKTNEKNASFEESEEKRIKPKVKVKKPAPPVPERASSVKEDIEKPPTPKSATSDRLDSKKQREEMNAIECVQKLDTTEKLVEKGSERRGSVPVNLYNPEPVRTLRRTVSDRGGNGVVSKEPVNKGDILTKVAIPRSQSFLNANGPLSRYSGRHKTNAKNDIISPLGFKELFNEFRLNEGLESLDDILNAIIDAEGMSFNDLKPIYKEFLLKLAVTLTKDELYQRSKIIMRRQKKINKKCSFRRKTFISSIGLNKIFRKTASRLGKNKNSRPTNLEFTSIVFQSNNKQFESNLSKINKSISFRTKKRAGSKRRLVKRLERNKNKNVYTTSEDSDFFQPKRNTTGSGGGPNRSSSGYFSCSECSCEGEHCTCTRTDKCYCALGKKSSYILSSSDESRLTFERKPSFRKVEEPDDSLKSCSCDTESCVDSAKCYCIQNECKRFPNKMMHITDSKRIFQTSHSQSNAKLHRVPCHNNNRVGIKDPSFDQIKEVDSDSSLSQAATSATAWQINDRNAKQRGSVKSKNSEYTVSSPQCYPNFVGHFLKEIQNTQKLDRMNLESNIRHTYFPSKETFMGKNDYQTKASFPNGRRQYSSMRCRSEFTNDLPQKETLRRSVSYRTKNFFNSVRSKHSCDSIMNHIKFPNSSHVDSSLRFPRRMDVYNSFSESRLHDNFFGHSNSKENRRRGISEYEENTDAFYLNKNAQRLDYNLFESQKGMSSKGSKKKVLVVSARDTKGKVLYMGTSNRCDDPLKTETNFPESPGTNAMAVKKSAEIAALFSDVTSRQKLVPSDYAKDQKQINYRARSNSYRSTNLENTLGYLP